MSNVIKIRALNDDETVAALKMPKFCALKPVRCSRCDHRGSFARRIFSIFGVPKSKFCDDVTQATISSYITETFGIAYVFFKSPGSGNKLYADSAVCPECQSTKIVFDIEMTEDFFREAAKALDHTEEEVRRRFGGTVQDIAKSDERKAEPGRKRHSVKTNER